MAVQYTNAQYRECLDIAKEMVENVYQCTPQGFQSVVYQAT